MLCFTLWDVGENTVDLHLHTHKMADSKSSTLVNVILDSAFVSTNSYYCYKSLYSSIGSYLQVGSLAETTTTYSCGKMLFQCRGETKCFIFHMD